MNPKENLDTLNIHRYKNGALSPMEDQVGIEIRKTFHLENGEAITLACTEIHLEELELGVRFSHKKGQEELGSLASTSLGFNPMDYDKLRESFEAFSHASPLFKATGSVHSGQLMDANYQILFFTEDMGRHNVIDKIIGFALKNQMDLSDKILMISSRMPLELVEKAHGAGFRTIASVSAPTREAVLFARKNKLNLVGMFRENRFNIYSGI